MVATLYDLEQTLTALMDTVDLVQPDQEAEFALEFQGALKQCVEKRDRVGQFLAHLESQIELSKKERARLADREKSIGRVIERIENYVRITIESLGVDEKVRYRKLEGNTTTFSLRACPPSVEIVDVAAVPQVYKVLSVRVPAELWEKITDSLDLELLEVVQEETRVVDVRIDKEAIAADLKTAHEVPGADLRIGKHSLVRK